MTNIELLRNAKVGDKFRNGRGDVIEIVEMPEFSERGSPLIPYGKLIVNGVPVSWLHSNAFLWRMEASDPDHGLTPIPAEPVVGLKPAREWKVLLAILECGDRCYRVINARNGGFLGQRDEEGTAMPLYAGPSYAEAVAACEADMEGK